MIHIGYGIQEDINGWMSLVQKVSSSFPGLKTEEALTKHWIQNYFSNGVG